MPLDLCQRDEQGRQHRKYIGLNERYQRIDHEHEQREEHRDYGRPAYHDGAKGSEDEDERDERQDNHVSSHHVGKETDHEGRRFGEDSEHLNERHDGQRELQPQRHIGPEGLFPILFGSLHVDHDKGTQGQHHGNGDVTRQVGATGEDDNQPQEVHQQDEEEYREQIGGKARRLVTQRALDDSGIDKLDEELDGPYPLRGAL